MRPARFAYIAPTCAAEALEALARHGDDARLLAGGQSFVPMMNLRIARPALIVDLNRCSDLFYLREDDGAVVVGAMQRQGAVEHDAIVRMRCPLLARALPYVGYPAHRTRGTVGGSFAQADPAAELPGVAVALDARFAIDGPTGIREVAAADFFLGPLMTAIAPGEMLREIRFPIAPASALASFVESGVRRHDVAIAGIAAQVVVASGGRCTDARIAAIGVGERPLRLTAAESAINGHAIDARTIEQAVAAALAVVSPLDDSLASADYRRKLVAVLIRRALLDMAGRDTEHRRVR